MNSSLRIFQLILWQLNKLSSLKMSLESLSIFSQLNDVDEEKALIKTNISLCK